MLTVRHKLTSTDFSDLSNSSRSYLVLVLELFLLGWPTKLADPVEAFYDSCLPKQGRAPPMETTKHHSQNAEDPSAGGSGQTQHQHSSSSTGNYYSGDLNTDRLKSGFIWIPNSCSVFKWSYHSNPNFLFRIHIIIWIPNSEHILKPNQLINKNDNLKNKMQVPYKLSNWVIKC